MFILWNKARALPEFLLLFLVLYPSVAAAQNKRPESRDYYKKWLDEDVIHIVTDEERSVFQKLSNDEEKAAFIEQFWLRRDPDPKTSINEYREEHYRRIQYANDHFATGIPGWKTDRGMIYIKFGQPAQIEAYPSGGHYNRPSHEGGGSTSTYPFEVWRYRDLRGIGQDIEIEFVDQTLSGEYAIAQNPWTKDALLQAGASGPTMSEMLGLSTKADRVVPKTNPMPGHNPSLIGYGRLKDQPFEKLELLTKLQKAPALGNPELRQFVHSEIKYRTLPFRVRSDFLKIDEENYLVPLTLKVSNRELQYQGLGGIHRTVLHVYGELLNVAGMLVTSFEESVAGEIPEDQLRTELKRFSLYQKIVQLPPGRYKLQLVIKDEYSAKIGVAEHLIVVPKIAQQDLATSSIVPAVRIESMAAVSYSEFGMGPVRVFPDPAAEAKKGGELPLFFQIYNAMIAPGSDAPLLNLQYVVSTQGKELMRQKEEIRDTRGPLISVVKYLPLEGLAPGTYLLEVNITDALKKATVVRQLQFTIKG